MSKLKLKTASDLEKFLYILAEESVKKSKNTIREDSEQTAFMQALKGDKKLYSQGLYEQEDEDADPVGAEAGSAAEEAETDEEEVEDEELDVEEEIEDEDTDSAAEEKPSFITVRDDINDIRSGGSLKVPDTRQSLETYVSRLSDDEKAVLSTFLKAIANIMHGRVSGSEAQDPSDDPLRIQVGSSNGESQDLPAEEDPAPEVEKDTDEEGDSEDTSPPIKVGKSEDQINETFRKKVLQLMNA